ncbi:MAG: pentapeptide repeat-containing protein [Thermodesulfobacteriota bacterium]
MANEAHVKKLLEGVEAWNEWRATSHETPDLEGVDFTLDVFRESPLAKKKIDGNWVVDLWNANLEQAILADANLEGAILYTAKLCGADLRNANLRRATLVNSDLRETILAEADLQGAHLLRANLRGADLEDADLQGALLWNANFVGARLWDANLRGADLHDATFRGANLTNADLQGAELSRANLECANVTGVKFSRDSRQQAFRGIRVATCYGDQDFKRFAQDQDYIEQLRARPRWGPILFWIWYIFADCGRSFSRWAGWSVGMAVTFSFIYYWLGPKHIHAGDLGFSWTSMLYYSVVTFTTLGYGDIRPITEGAAMVVMVEVILGYIMLGGLISILANKVARRS